MSDTARTPTLGALALTGNAPSLDYTWVTFPSLETAALTGIASTATVDAPRLTSVGAVSVTGFAPQLFIAHSGTSITNINASTARINHINACDYSGFQARPNELIRNANGHWVLPEFFEDRHPTNEGTAVHNKLTKGPLRPEPIGNERHIDNEYPNGVSQDDL